MEKIVNWNNKELVILEESDANANTGMLEKFWVEDLKTHKVYLVKGSGWFGYEPFSEKIAYIVGKQLGIDVLEYDIIPAELFKGQVKISHKCKYLSICEKIDINGYSITSVAEIKKAVNATIIDDNKKVTNREIMYKNLPRKYIDTMLVFDAIIGNTDRHFGNIHLLKNENGDLIGAPILDNGASLLATYYDVQFIACGSSVGKMLNKAYTLEKNHDLQMEHVEDTIDLDFDIDSKIKDIMKEVEPILSLMPKTRANAIREYLPYRVNKYLTYVRDKVNKH